MVYVLDSMPKHVHNGSLPEASVVYLADLVNKTISYFIKMVGINITGPMEPLWTAFVSESALVAQEGKETTCRLCQEDTVVSVLGVKNRFVRVSGDLDDLLEGGWCVVCMPDSGSV